MAVGDRETRAARLSASSTITGFKQESRRSVVGAVYHISLEFMPKYPSSFGGFKLSSTDTEQCSLGSHCISNAVKLSVMQTSVYCSYANNIICLGRIRPIL